MGKFAEKTRVSIAKSKAEIEKTLSRYGAESFAYGWEAERATIGFHLSGKFIRFNLVLPKKNEKAFTLTPTGLKRSPAQAEKEWDQACRSSWRALSLVIKAKLEAVASGITSLEDEFLSHIMLPNGETVGEHLIPQIETTYQDGKLPKLLPFGG